MKKIDFNNNKKEVYSVYKRAKNIKEKYKYET